MRIHPHSGRILPAEGPLATRAPRWSFAGANGTERARRNAQSLGIFAFRRGRSVESGRKTRISGRRERGKGPGADPDDARTVRVASTACTFRSTGDRARRMHFERSMARWWAPARSYGARAAWRPAVRCVEGSRQSRAGDRARHPAGRHGARRRTARRGRVRAGRRRADVRLDTFGTGDRKSPPFERSRESADPTPEQVTRLRARASRPSASPLRAPPAPHPLDAVFLPSFLPLRRSPASLLPSFLPSPPSPPLPPPPATRARASARARAEKGLSSTVRERPLGRIARWTGRGL